MTVETVLDASAMAAVVTVLLGLLLKIVAGQFQPVDPDGFRKGFKTRGLAMELARGVHDVELILGKENTWNREVMRQEQYVDFAFIVSYSALFLLTAALLWQSHVRYGSFLAILVGVCAIGAAAFDVREDIFILKLTKQDLAHDKDRSEGLINSCRQSAICKWSLLFAAMAFLSPLFWYGHWKGLEIIFGLAGILLALTGFCGLLSLTGDSVIERATKAMGVIMLLLTIILCWAAFQPTRLFCV
ncbi:MAG TPA: hypothetical protein VEU96_30520 [Bryobacteraceae bacterium]|nr:hypothetical protein [Bryobacteraceae bacterium]